MSKTPAKSMKSTSLSEPNLCGKTVLKCLDFVYEWSVEGFNNVLDRNYEIRSPIFKIDRENQVKWRLVLFPKHKYPQGPCVAASLTKLSQDAKPYIVRYALSLINKAGEANQVDWREKIFSDYSNSDECTLISHTKLVEDRFLSENGLKIRCELDVIISDESDNDEDCDSDELPVTPCLLTPRENLNVLSIEEVNKKPPGDHGNNLKLNNLAKEKNCINNSQFNITDENLKTNYSELDTTVHDSLELLSDDLRALYVTKNFTDIIISAENVKFSAHKVIVCSRSDFFKNICVERKDNMIVFEDVKSEVMENVLYYLYSGMIRQPSVELGLDLLHSAKKFRLFHFQQLVIEVLMKNISVANVTDILRHAEDLKLRELKNACLKFVVANHSEVVQTDKWKRMLKINPNIAGEVLITKSSVQKRNNI